METQNRYFGKQSLWPDRKTDNAYWAVVGFERTGGLFLMRHSVAGIEVISESGAHGGWREICTEGRARLELLNVVAK
jgi:hypothetical protein